MPRALPKRYAVTDADLPDDLRVANCARCSCVLVAPGQPNAPEHLEVIAGRVYSRPHCSRCLPIARTLPLPTDNLFAPTTQEN